MAITTYSELQTAVGNWLGRTDLSSRLPEFIALTEPKLRRRLRAAQKRSTPAATIGQLYITLASDVKEVRSLATSASPIYTLRQVDPGELGRLSRTGTGRPVAYTVLDGKLYFDVVPDLAYAYVMTYLEAIPALSGSQTQNSILTNSPDLYLYGSLVEAEPYLEHDERVPLWKEAFEAALTEENIYRESQELGASPEMALPVTFGEDDGS